MKKIFIIPTILLSTLFLSQSFETHANPKIDEIQKNFSFKKYPKNILKEFSGRIGAEEEPVTVFEHIPGEIIGWSNARGAYTTSQNFQIINGKLLEINILPASETFFNNLSKFNKRNRHFEFNSINGRTYDAVFLKKQKGGKYLLTIDLISIDNDSDGSINDFNRSPIYNVEYETLDFKTFRPLRIKKRENKEWELIN
ncbi:hypothetical protein SD427_18995 (plasmid) [Chryseobacterium sp. JJR-5R]|uniref:hypothetical protein n=1 Tax=Chryseobacterium sp. JJR-5R TaxID=3093923 RepID=UPI002A762889|nr:hypothetical protein [Chryseobacterium sp. JJR-5R]WPO84617.1 hypothetical protein SD427_18995 [Chryseobacterium sp. JJR-5R]